MCAYVIDGATTPSAAFSGIYGMESYACSNFDYTKLIESGYADTSDLVPYKLYPLSDDSGIATDGRISDATTLEEATLNCQNAFKTTDFGTDPLSLCARIEQ